MATKVNISKKQYIGTISQWWFGFRLKPIFNTAPAASKTMLASKGVKIDSNISNSHL